MNAPNAVNPSPQHRRRRLLRRIVAMMAAVAVLLAALAAGWAGVRALRVRAATSRVTFTTSLLGAEYCSDVLADAVAAGRVDARDVAIDRTRAVLVNGEANPLQCAFVHPDKALSALRDAVDLSAASRWCILPPNALTWRCYAAWANAHWEDWDDGLELAAFFDIYENASYNDDLILELDRMQRASPDGLTVSQLAELAVRFPDYAPIARYSSRTAAGTANPVG